MEDKLKILELYSGIGGMHFALKEAELSYEVVAAADINTTANQIYTHNFPHTKLITKCIESIAIKELNKLSMDMIVMSPPCQPFCRVGKQKDVLDERSKSFLHLLSILPKLEKIPAYILVENVKGFDTSESRYRLLTTLMELNYHVQEFLLSPLQFGVPNSRLRYYLIAKRKPLNFNFVTKPEFRTDIPECVEKYLRHGQLNEKSREKVTQRSEVTETLFQREASLSCHCVLCRKKTTDLPENTLHVQSDKSPLSRIAEVAVQNRRDLQASNNSRGPANVAEACDLDSSISHNSASSYNCGDSSTVRVDQSQMHLDSAESMNQSECLEDAEDDVDNHSEEIPLYEKYQHICGTVGNYFEKQNADYFEQYLIPEKFFRRFWVMDLVNSESKNSCCFTKRYAHHMEGSGSIVEGNTQEGVDLSYYKQKRVYDNTVHEAVRMRKLRFFTPREIANLMCFPPSFSIPAELSNIQMYRVLGNSLNVHVVSVLLRLLTHGD